MCCMIHFASCIDLHFFVFTVIFLFVIILTEILGTQVWANTSGTGSAVLGVYNEGTTLTN